MALKNIVLLASAFSIVAANVVTTPLPALAKAASSAENIEESFPSIALAPATTAIPMVLPSASSAASGPYGQLGKTIVNYGYVSPVLLRGSQPTNAGFVALKEAGVKTIINLRDGKEDILDERKVVQNLGMKYVSIPLTVLKGVRKDQVHEFLSKVTGGDELVFVHCRQGQDRCGTMVAMYRMHEQGWSAEQAYKEMISFGFHPMFIRLRDSVYETSRELGRPSIPPPNSEIVADLKARFKRALSSI